MLRIPQQVAEILELLFHQEPGDGGLEQMRDRFRRRMRAMRRAERIVHIQIAEGSESPGQLRVVLFLTGPEAGVLDQRDTAAREPSRHGHARRRVGDELHRPPKYTLEI